MKKLLLTLMIVAIALPTGGAMAATLLVEDFSYAPGTLLTDTGYWANHSGTSNFIPVASPGLSYPGYSGSGIGEAASMLPTGEDVHTTAPWTVNSGSVYMAFMVNFSAAQATGDYFTHFYQGSTTFYGRVFAKLVSGSVNFGITRGSGTANYASTPFALGETHLVVVKYTFVDGTTNDTADLWVNPALGGGEPTPLVSNTDLASTDATGIIAIALRQGSSSNGATQFVDGFRVGTSWDDVVGGGVPPSGAWCFTNGACEVLDAAACAAQGGTYQGDGTLCDPNPCPILTQGACCLPNGDCFVATQADCAAQQGAWQGENTLCSPNPCPFPQYTVCELRPNDGDGVPMLNNQRVQVEAVAHVNSGTWNTTTQQFEMGDGGCCVSVFGGSINPPVAIGDRVLVKGTLIHYNGLTEISNPDLQVTILSSGNPVDDPGTITTGELAMNGEQYEACLIRIECATIVEGTWPAEGSNSNLTIDDGTGPVTLRIDKETNIDGTPQPTGPITIVGVAYQFDSSVPHTEGYQILPRSLDDITPCIVPVPGACCAVDGSCALLTEGDCAAQGGLFLGEGTVCEPNPCPQPSGACCYPDGSCAVTLQADCPGLWLPMIDCDPNPCQQPTGACCFPDGACVVTMQSDCGTGNWIIYEVCEPNPCPQPPPTGACCFADGTCVILTQELCLAAQGEWYGPTVGCEPNPCPPPTPVEKSSWGQIKNMYR